MLVKRLHQSFILLLLLHDYEYFSEVNLTDLLQIINNLTDSKIKRTCFTYGNDLCLVY